MKLFSNEKSLDVKNTGDLRGTFKHHVKSSTDNETSQRVCKRNK